MGETNGDFAAEIAVVEYLARKAIKAKKDLESEEDFTFSRLEYAAVYKDGSDTPEIWAGPVPPLYLWKSRLTSGIVQGEKCLKHWKQDGDVSLDRKKIVQLAISGESIHLLGKAKSQSSLPLPLPSVDTTLVSTPVPPRLPSIPTAQAEPVTAQPIPVSFIERPALAQPTQPPDPPRKLATLPSALRAVTKAPPVPTVHPVRKAPPAFYKHWAPNLESRRETQPLTASMLSQADIFDDCARLIQQRIELNRYENGQAPFLCLPSQLGHQLSKERDPVSSLKWDVILEHCGFPGELRFLVKLLARYKEWMLPVKVQTDAGISWILLTYGKSIMVWDPVGTAPPSTYEKLVSSLERNMGVQFPSKERFPPIRCNPQDSGLYVFLTMLKLADIFNLAENSEKEPIDLIRVKPRLADVSRHISKAP